jgi:hypothetical protein
MVTYTLEINFTAQQLSAIKKSGGVQLVISKPYHQYNPQMAWQVIDPQETNTITWNEKYQIYTTQSQVIAGNPLYKFTTSELTEIGQKFVLNSDGKIKPEGTGESSTGITLENNYSESLIAMGLAQSATVNGNPVDENMLYVEYTDPSQGSYVLTPGNSIYIGMQYQTTPNSTTLWDGSLNQFSLESGGGTLKVKYNGSGFSLG